MVMKILWAVGIVVWLIIIVKQMSEVELGLTIFCYMSFEILWMLCGLISCDVGVNPFDSADYISFLTREIIGAIIILSFIFLWKIKLEDVYDDYKRVNKADLTITFSRFKNLYTVAPNKWICESYRVGYEDPSYYYGPVAFKFKHFYEYVQYRRFIKQARDEKQKLDNDRRMARITEDWIKDIEQYKKDNNITTF